MSISYASADGEALLLLADALETAFSRAFQPLVDLIKEVFSHSLLFGGDAIQGRLAGATDAIEIAMKEYFPSSDEFGEEWYSAVFVAVGIQHGRAFVTWIGSPQAKLFRKSVCVEATTPHVVILPHSNGSEGIVTSRTMNTIPSCPKDRVEVSGPWELESGDVLVLADYRLFALFSDDEICEMIANEADSPARMLVERSQALRYRFAQAAVVARILD